MNYLIHIALEASTSFASEPARAFVSGCDCLVLQEFDPECIREFLDLLTPARARITWASRVHEQQDTPATASTPLPPPQLCGEPIYGTQYDVQPLPQAWLEAWSSGRPIQGLHLPDVNPFVPDDLSLTGAEGPKEGLPVVLLEDGGVRLWQRTDLRFENPKATIVLDFQVRVCCSQTRLLLDIGCSSGMVAKLEEGCCVIQPRLYCHQQSHT